MESPASTRMWTSPFRIADPVVAGDDPLRVVFSRQRDQIVIIGIACCDGDPRRIRYLVGQNRDRLDELACVLCADSFAWRGRSSTSLISPINLGQIMSSNNAWPDIQRSISRVDGHRPIAADTNTFASMTTRNGSAGTSTSNFACLLHSQAQRLVVVVQRRCRSSFSHRLTYRT